MAPVIWGLPLDEIKWSKFKSSYMWNNRYHLRRTKFIVYQLAMICCVVGESLGTAALSDYIDQQRFASLYGPEASISNNDFVGAFSYNIFAGVFVAFIFGAAFFFDLFWPERHEDHGIKVAWKWSAIASAIFQLAAVLTTTIIVASHHANFEGLSPEQENRTLSMWKGSPMLYKKNPRGVAAVVFGWVGFVFILYSIYIMWSCYAHNDKYGPLADHVRKSEDMEKGVGEKSVAGAGYDGTSDALPMVDRTIPEPAQAHTAPVTSTEAAPTGSLHSIVQNDRLDEPYNVATASTLSGTKAVP